MREEERERRREAGGDERAAPAGRSARPRSRLGPARIGHGRTVAGRNLGTALQEAARFRGAEPILERALERAEALLAPSDPILVQLRFARALCRARLGGIGESEAELLRLEEELRALLPPDHPLPARAALALAGANQVSGAAERADRWHAAACEAHLAVRGPADHRTIDAHDRYGHFELGERDHEHAARLLQVAVAGHERRGNTASETYASACNVLATALFRSESYAEAEAAQRRALEAMEARFDARDPNRIVVRFSLGSCIARQARLEEAAPILLACWDDFRAALPPGHALVAQAARDIADACERNGEAERAERRRRVHAELGE